jgi:hypothetical protein
MSDDPWMKLEKSARYILSESVSNNASKSRSNERTKTTSIHIKNDTKIVIIVPLDISIN